MWNILPKLEHWESATQQSSYKSPLSNEKICSAIMKRGSFNTNFVVFSPFSSTLTQHIHFSSRQHKCVIIISSKCKFPFYEKCQQSLVVWINLGPELFEGKLWNVQRKCKFFFVAAQKFTQRLTWAFTFEGRITKWR